MKRDVRSDKIEFTWTRYPDAHLAGTVVAGDAPKPYTLTLPRRGKTVGEDLASVGTPQGACAFTARWGWLTEDARHTWASAIQGEAAIMKACLEIWEGLQRRGGLQQWIRRAGGVKRLRELTLGVDQEWRDRWRTIERQGPERATAIAPTWLWWAVRRGLDGLRLVPAQDGLIEGRWDAFGLWRWRLEIPDLLTFCYLELAVAMAQGRLPSWCPYCCQFYLRRRRDQRTCGKDRCRAAAVRAKRTATPEDAIQEVAG